MKNKLGMKPGEVRKRFADSFATLEDLKLAIAKAELVCDEQSSVVYVCGALELEAECLSDGSVVHNILIITEFSSPGESSQARS